MKYAFLIYSEERQGDGTPQDMAPWTAFGEEAMNKGVMVAGEALVPAVEAKTVRVRSSRLEVTDGPFAETREQLGGFYILDVPDLDAAIEWAAKIPAQEWGSIEIRPLVDFSAEQ